MTDKLHELIEKAGASIPGEAVSFAPTGLIGLDWALGGGIPRGRITELFGKESSGKSTLGLQCGITEAKRTDLPGLWLDYEFAWDPDYIEGLGGRPDKDLVVAAPGYFEDGAELAVKAMRAGQISSVWFDSTGLMQSTEKGLGALARAMAHELPRLVREVAEAGIVCGFISQTRDVVSTMPSYAGPRQKATGGNALKFAASVRVEVSHYKQIKGQGPTVSGKPDEVVVGRRVRARVRKNKVAVPNREAEFDVIDGHGFDRRRHLLDLAIATGQVKKSGSWITLPDGEKYQGVEAAAGGLVKLTDEHRGSLVRGIMESLR